jgi:hypothetical protein
MGDQIMGDQTILDYTAKPNGGLDARGLANDPAFELTKDTWRTKLQTLGASETYSAELARQTAYAGRATSERGFAFLLDLANQFGSSRVEEQYKRAVQPGFTKAPFSRRWKTLSRPSPGCSSNRRSARAGNSFARQLCYRTNRRLWADARPTTREIHRTGESLPSMARRTILIGGNPCFRNVSWNSCRLKAAPRKLR